MIETKAIELPVTRAIPPPAYSVGLTWEIWRTACLAVQILKLTAAMVY